MLNTIVDLSHYNGNTLDFAAAAESGIDAVIHKATQGLAFIDPRLALNRDAARAAGLLFGFFHFGTDEDGTAQAQYFLESAQPRSDDLLALDFEANGAGSTMTQQQARDFATAINARAGKWPVLYSGNHLKTVVAVTPDPVLANCPLWLAEYGPAPRLPNGWKTWSLWQWTDGAVGVNPTPVAGIGHCNRDYFNGNRLDLPGFWATMKN